MEAFHLALNEIPTWKSGNPNDSKYKASAILTCLHFLCLTVKKFQVWWFLMRVFTYYVSQASEIKVKNM